MTTSCASGVTPRVGVGPALAAPRASRCASRRSSARRPRRGRRRSSGARAPRPRAGAPLAALASRVSPRPVRPGPDRPRRVRLRAPRRRRRRRRAVAPARPWSAPGVARAAETTGSGETLERATEGRGAAGDRGASRSPPAASASSDADASVDSRRAAERVVDAFLALPREDQIDIVRRLAFPDAALPESSARAEEARRADERRGVADERDDDEKRYIETAGRSRPLASSDPLESDDLSSSAEDLDADLSARLADARDGWEAPSPSVAGFASNDSVETASSTPSPPSTLSRESSAAAFGGIRDLFENATREGEAVAASVASAALRVDGDVFVAGAFGALVLIAAASELASATERSSRNESATTPRESAPEREEAEGEQRGGPVVGSRRREEGGARPTKAVASEGGVLWSRRSDDEANQGYGFGTDSEASSDDGVARAAPAVVPRRARRRRPRCFGLGPRPAARRGRRRAEGGARAAAEGDEVLRFDGRGAGRGKAGRFSYGSGSRRGSDRDRFGGLGPVEDENMEDVRMSPGSGTREAAPRR